MEGGGFSSTLSDKALLHLVPFLLRAVVYLGSILGVVQAGAVVHGGGPADEVFSQAQVPPLQTLVYSGAP
jgi:hypothetical protein